MAEPERISRYLTPSRVLPDAREPFVQVITTSEIGWRWRSE